MQIELNRNLESVARGIAYSLMNEPIFEPIRKDSTFIGERYTSIELSDGRSLGCSGGLYQYKDSDFSPSVTFGLDGTIKGIPEGKNASDFIKLLQGFYEKAFQDAGIDYEQSE